MNRRNIGSFYEERAENYLIEHDFTIIEKNFRCKIGEIDVIAIKDGILRFIEVKYRKDTEYGYALSAVTRQKQRKIKNAAMWFLNAHSQYNDIPCSFDVIAIQGEHIEYIFNGFYSF